jgi:hypothetical protein
VSRKLALLLVVLVAGATLTAVVLFPQDGSDAPRDAACAEAAEQTSDATDASDAFNFGDAVGCSGRRAEANGRREPPK